MTYVLVFRVPIFVATPDDTAAVGGNGQYMVFDDMLSALQRQQALRRKVQQGDEEDAAAGAEASAGAFPQETTAPSDLRFDVPTGAAWLQISINMKTSIRISCTVSPIVVFRVIRCQCQGKACRDPTPRLRVRSVHAGADPSADELRQKLHERIEVLTLLSFHINPMLAIAGIEPFHHMLGSSLFSEHCCVLCSLRAPVLLDSQLRFEDPSGHLLSAAGHEKAAQSSRREEAESKGSQGVAGQGVRAGQVQQLA